MVYYVPQIIRRIWVPDEGWHVFFVRSIIDGSLSNSEYLERAPVVISGKMQF